MNGNRVGGWRRRYFRKGRILLGRLDPESGLDQLGDRSQALALSLCEERELTSPAAGDACNIFIALNENQVPSYRIIRTFRRANHGHLEEVANGS